MAGLRGLQVFGRTVTALLLATGCATATPPAPTPTMTPAATTPLSTPTAATFTPGPTGTPRPTATALPPAPPFASGPTFAILEGPANPISVDFDGNGWPDVAIPGTTGLEVALNYGPVLLIDATGLHRPVTLPAESGDVVVAADATGDGALDLLMAGYDHMLVFVNDGAGAFTGPVTPEAYPEAGDKPLGDAFWIDAGDLNGDEAIDAVVAYYGADGPMSSAPGHVAVFLNDGDGEFAPARIDDCPACTALVIGDFDEDGTADLATASFGGFGSFRHGMGDGTFAEPVTFDLHANAAAIYAADLDGDGHLDLVSGNDASNTITVILGLGDGSFSDPTHLIAGNNHSGAIVDINGDGDLDILSAGYTDTLVNVYLGDGLGSFVRTAGIDVAPATARGLAVADFDRDGTLDIVLTDDDDGTLTLLRGG